MRLRRCGGSLNANLLDVAKCEGHATPALRTPYHYVCTYHCAAAVRDRSSCTLDRQADYWCSSMAGSQLAAVGVHAIVVRLILVH